MDIKFLSIVTNYLNCDYSWLFPTIGGIQDYSHYSLFAVISFPDT